MCEKYYESIKDNTHCYLGGSFVWRKQWGTSQQWLLTSCYLCSIVENGESEIKKWAISALKNMWKKPRVFFQSQPQIRIERRKIHINGHFWTTSANILQWGWGCTVNFYGFCVAEFESKLRIPKLAFVYFLTTKHLFSCWCLVIENMLSNNTSLFGNSDKE